MARVKTKTPFSKFPSLLDSLQVDRVYSYGQITRHFGLRPELLPSSDGFHHFQMVIKPASKVKGNERLVQFVTHKKKMELRLLPYQIMHYCGAAEMRLQLGAAVEHWANDAGAAGKSEQPDALWHHPERGTLAIEFDTGSYTKNLIDHKIIAFEAFAGTIWGVTTLYRKRRLTLKWARKNVQVIYVPWWMGLTEINP